MALAQPTPTSKKTVSAREKWRGKTNYKSKRFSGYAPISFAMVAEIGRLTAGKSTQLVYVILTASLGQIVKPTEEFNERACDLRTSDLAELCACDDRTIQRELGDLARRKIILWDQSKKGLNNVTPLFRSWCSLPDYKPAPILEPAPDSEDEPVLEDPAQNTKVTTQVTKRPVYVPAGKKSRSFPVDCGVSALQFDVRALDADCSAVVKDGVLLVTLEPRWDASRGVEGLKQTKGIEEKPRHGCRGEQANGAKSSRRTESETARVCHPRADELSSLFDPFLLKSCGKSLSGDLLMLQQACEAIQEVPHDYLVKCVVDRAARPISGPRAAMLICKEISHNWKRAKDLPPAQRDLTAEDIAAMVDRDRKALAEKRRKLA